MASFTKIASINEIGPGESKRIEKNGTNLALFNVEGVFYAIDATCSHKGGPLSEGPLDGRVVTCPWHGARFDVSTGQALSAPATAGVKRYNVRIVGEDIEAEI